MFLASPLGVESARWIPGGTLPALIEECRALLEDFSYPAVRRWLDVHPGGRVVGHFQAYFPEELIHAAGMLPIKLMGAGGMIDVRLADARIASFVCSVLRTSLELGLSGRLDFLSAYVTPPICDAARHACGIWARNRPELLCQTLYLPQNTGSAHAEEYLTAEYRRLLGEFAALSGRAVGDDDLRQSIALFNANRRLIRALDRVRRESPWRLPLLEAYMLLRAGGMMPREQHNVLLARALAGLEARQAKAQDRLRVIFEGGFCEQPSLDLLAVLQELCYVVEDDLLAGLKWLDADVPVEGDPVRTLARAYLGTRSRAAFQHDRRETKAQRLLDRVRETRADAVILAAAKMCEPGLEEQTACAEALSAAGIPYLILEFEERTTVFEQTRMEMETFVESILFA